jgi:hypothetical protein
MSLAVVMAFEILAALALGFVVGRIWQIRRDELDAEISRCHPSRAFRAFKVHLARGRRPQHVVARRIENAVDQRGQAPRQPAATVAAGGRLRSEA